MKVKAILVSQPEPKLENSPYNQIIDKQKVKIDFHPFISIQGVDVKDIRKQKIDLTNFTAIVLTSRKAVDHYFRIAEEMRFKVPDTMKYFCQSEAVAYYLQKYITYRKRKIYIGKREFKDLLVLMKKHKEEQFLYPGSETLKPDYIKGLNEAKLKWKHGVFYRTQLNDLSDIDALSYDILTFFTPSDIDALFKNFPNFSQNKMRIAVFGKSTLEAAEKAGLQIDIKAPTEETPSMTMALEQYLIKVNKKA